MFCHCSDTQSQFEGTVVFFFFFWVLSGYIVGAEEYFIYLVDIQGLSLELLNSYVYQETPII